MFKLDLHDKFLTALDIINKKTTALKKSVEPYGAYYFIKLTMALPILLI